MRPPSCAICKRRFDPSKKEGGLMYFKLIEEESEYNERFKQDGFVGHPAGREWFCKNHIKAAKEKKHLGFKVLRQQIKEEEE